MALQEPFDVFFQDFNNNDDGRSVVFYPVPPVQVEAWITAGGTPATVEKCWVKQRATLVAAGEIEVSEDVPTLQLRYSESVALGMRSKQTIDAEGKRYQLKTPDNQEGIMYWTLELVPGVPSNTL